jgi:ABC-type oligopeptide transport system substrate-binding subunit
MVLLLLLFSLQSHAASFKVRLHEDLGTLDWNNGEVNGEIVYQMMEGLFRAGHDGKPVPAVAKSFSWNSDKTELKLTLGPSRWSDGQEVCAQNFADSWERLRSKAFASPFAHYALPLGKIQAEGCKSLTVTFHRPAPEAPALFAHEVFFPVRLDQLKDHPKAFNGDGEILVNGPYKIADWKRNVSTALERNLAYAGPKPKLDRIEFRFIAEDSTAKTLFEEKELDWMKEVPQLLRTPELEKSAEFRRFPSLIVYYFGLNAKASALLEDSSIRSALSGALDRSELNRVLGSECHGQDSWVPPPLLKATATSPKKDFTDARRKLQAAKKAGKLDLELYVYNKSNHKLLAEWAQGQWEKKLGVRIPIKVEDGKVYWSEMNLRPLPIFFGGVTAPYGHARAFLQEFLTGSSANWTGWSSPEYDSAVAEEKFAKAEQVLEHSAHVIPLYRRDTAALVQSKWKGFFINPLGQAFLSEVH